MARHLQTQSQRHRKENPSFSSTLLDAIYQSIDDKEEGFKTTGEDMASSRRMEKKASISRCKSMADYPPVLLNSSSTSSDSSSSAGGFSSSESESVKPSSTSRYSYNNVQRPKPIRTSLSLSVHEQMKKEQEHRQGGFVKTKSRALKIYSDLKKVKQPISPGGRLATLFNSVFSGKKPGKADQKHSKSGNTSTCSSASSFSRSCLSKTPSSTGGAGTKRSVRFYPVSVIVDEDCRPCGHKNLHQEGPTPAKLNSSIKEQLMLKNALEEKRRVQEAAMDLLKNYRNNNNQNNTLDSEDDDDDDDASCASSDLFELDNLSAIGIDQRYNEELPVYETTHLAKNRAIAKGLIL